MPVDVVRYPRYRFPASIISHAVWLYYRCGISSPSAGIGSGPSTSDSCALAPS